MPPEEDELSSSSSVGDRASEVVDAEGSKMLGSFSGSGGIIMVCSQGQHADQQSLKPDTRASQAVLMKYWMGIAL